VAIKQQYKNSGEAQSVKQVATQHAGIDLSDGMLVGLIQPVGLVREQKAACLAKTVACFMFAKNRGRKNFFGRTCTQRARVGLHIGSIISSLTESVDWWLR
jgi:hypothetical protein